MDSVDELLNKLTELGFFKFALPENIERVCEIIRGDIGEEISDDYIGWGLWGEEEEEEDGGDRPLDRRIYWADAKSLSKYGICRFLEGIKPALEVEGVKIESLRDDCQKIGEHDFRWSVWINSREFLIEDTSLGIKCTRCLALKRTLEIVNELLEAVGSPERAYGQGDYNTNIALLTDELYEFIQCLPLPEDAKPYRSETMNCD